LSRENQPSALSLLERSRQVVTSIQKDNTLLSLPDYLFYRIDKWFRYRDDYLEQGGIANSRALTFLSVLETITISYLFGLVLVLTDISFASQSLKVALIVLAIFLWIINYIRYESKARVASIRARWRSESKDEERRRGIWVVAYIVFCFSVPLFAIKW